MPVIGLPGAGNPSTRSQCQEPRGWVGRLVLWSMNRRHSRVTDWGLRQVTVHEGDIILDVGCGGGRTVAKLAAAAPHGRVCAVDYAAESVAASMRTNRTLVAEGRVEIRQASVSDLPYPDSTFDLVTAVETHFWWQDLGAGMREIRRVLKPGGRLLVIAEFYNGQRYAKYADRIRQYTKMAVLDVTEHRAMFVDAGFDDVQVTEDARRGWIAVVGTKP